MKKKNEKKTKKRHGEGKTNWLKRTTIKIGEKDYSLAEMFFLLLLVLFHFFPSSFLAELSFSVALVLFLLGKKKKKKKSQFSFSTLHRCLGRERKKEVFWSIWKKGERKKRNKREIWIKRKSHMGNNKQTSFLFALSLSLSRFLLCPFLFLLPFPHPLPLLYPTDQQFYQELDSIE